MNSDDGLNLAEQVILDPLENWPLPLCQLASTWVPRKEMAAFLGQGLVSLTSRGLIEVRRFENWPAQWEQGVPVVGNDLQRESERDEVWSDDQADSILAAHITKAGIRYL
jgi:hypothetical protein